MSKLIVVTGGARSGKSRHAESLAKAVGSRVGYYATSVQFDREMVDRVAIHRAMRPSRWITIEEPHDLRIGDFDGDLLLVECLGTWLSNHLLRLGSPRSEGWLERTYALEVDLRRMLDGFIAECRQRSVHLILVTNEVGFGVVPPSPLGRVFRDVLGRLNQNATVLADEAYLVVSGVPIELKRLAASQRYE